MEDLSAVFSKYPFVVNYHLLKFERTQSTRRLKIVVDIVDGSRLIISEATTPRGFRYAYHWQDANGQLLARWDNAPHHHALPTFPDHFHDGQRIEPAVQPSIHGVLDYIAGRLQYGSIKQIG
jgi:hypothetical protein